MLDNIISFFKKVWEALKQLGKWLKEKILNFARNIRDFFLERSRKELLRKRKDLLAVSIKERLGNGNYGVVNCLYDTDAEEVFEEEAMALPQPKVSNFTSTMISFSIFR